MFHRSVRIAAASLSLVLIVCSQALPVLIDKNAKVGNELLRELEPSLHEKGMDVLQNWRETESVAAYNAHRALQPDRAIIAPLSGYESEVLEPHTAWERIRNDVMKHEWIRDFEKGRVGALCAVEGTVTGDDFFARWNKGSLSQRVFISFTKNDIHFAESLKHALEWNGYVVYTFLDSDGNLKNDAAVTGRMFAEAGHHFVIETQKSAESLGVRYEARVAERITEVQKIVEASRRTRETGVNDVAHMKQAWQEYERATKMFAEAGHHFVIETQKSAENPGVRGEATVPKGAGDDRDTVSSVASRKPDVVGTTSQEQVVPGSIKTSVPRHWWASLFPSRKPDVVGTTSQEQYAPSSTGSRKNMKSSVPVPTQPAWRPFDDEHNAPPVDWQQGSIRGYEPVRWQRNCYRPVWDP